jgi:transposase
MSNRVYLTKNDCGIPLQEDTPVRMRIPRRNATVKALHTRLQDAYRRDDVRLVRRISGRLDLLPPQASVSVLCARWGRRPACRYNWPKAFLLRGMESLVSHHSGGRPAQLTPTQKKRLGALLEAGPLVVGLETACWTAVLIRVLIWRAFGVLSNRHDVCPLLHNVGFAFHKARVVSDHLDAAKRLAWLRDKWPALVRAAKRCQGLRRFEDAARCAQGGSLSYTGATRGHQPEVPTRGTRKGSKVCGAIAYGSGRWF